ncbi:MAG: hypothetical protein ONB55_21840 [candidate division KSB1 bacterium]|nr:hypothetical protein [candidate division KSB1 bacterium]
MEQTLKVERTPVQIRTDLKSVLKSASIFLEQDMQDIVDLQILYWLEVNAYRFPDYIRDQILALKMKMRDAIPQEEGNGKA